MIEIVASVLVETEQNNKKPKTTQMRGERGVQIEEESLRELNDCFT